LISTVSTDLHTKQAPPVEFSKNARGVKNVFRVLKMPVEFVEIVETAQIAQHDTITRSRKILLPPAV